MTQIAKNSIVHSKTGSGEYKVEKLLHRGTGQGDIYRVRDKHKNQYALKLFHTGDYDKLNAQIENLIVRGKASPAFVHPIDVIEYKGQIGYVMELLDSAKYEKSSVLFNGISLGDGTRQDFPYECKLNVLESLCKEIKTIYEADIALLDLKFDNVFIDMDNLIVKIIDTDTAFGGKTKPLVRGTMGFMPPQVMRGLESPSRNNDAFALAVIIFMTLIGGHPYIGRKYNEDRVQDKDIYAFQTNPIYVFHPTDKTNRPEDYSQRSKDRIARYPDYFVKAMEQTFVLGVTDSSKFVTPAQWLEIIRRLIQEFYVCKYCGEEEFLKTYKTKDKKIRYKLEDKKCPVCGKIVKPPVVIFCEESNLPGAPLFNGNNIYSNELWDDNDGHLLFKVVRQKGENRFGLLSCAIQPVECELKNGEVLTYTKDQIIPIFLDATLRVGTNKINFVGGTHYEKH